MNLPLHCEPTSNGSYTSRDVHHAVEIGEGGQVHFFANDHESIGISLEGSASSQPVGDSPLVVLALTAFSLTGCAKSPYEFTVIATSGSISHNLTLTVSA